MLGVHPSQGRPDDGGRTHAPAPTIAGGARVTPPTAPTQAASAPEAALSAPSHATASRPVADRLDLPGELPPARSPAPVDRDEPERSRPPAARTRRGGRPAPSQSGPRGRPRWPAPAPRRPPGARARASRTAADRAQGRPIRCPRRRPAPCRRWRWRSRGPCRRSRRRARARGTAPGRLPAAPYQPNTGSSGMPTANGSHESVVPFARRSYQPPIAEQIAARASSARPPGAASSSPSSAAPHHDRPRRVRRHEARGDRLARLADVVDRGVHEVVEAADRELEEGHRRPEAHGRGRVPARDERDQRRRRPRRGPMGTGGPGATRPRGAHRAGGAAPAARPRGARRTR